MSGTHGVHLMTIISSFLAEANWQFDRRLHADLPHDDAASRMTWYSRSVRVWADHRMIPRVDPMGSTLMEQMKTTLSPVTRPPASSFQPRTDCSSMISWVILSSPPQRLQEIFARLADCASRGGKEGQTTETDPSIAGLFMDRQTAST